MAKETAPSVQTSASPADAAQFCPSPALCREGRGLRHFSCLYYDICLDKAAKGMWTGFTCAECFFYEKQETEPS